MICAAFGDNIHDAAGAGSVFGGEGVFKHGHFADRVERNIAEDCLPAPTVIGVCTIDLEPGLAAARTVGGEEILIHEDVALVDGGAVGGVEQRQVGDAAVEERQVAYLARGEDLAHLGLVGAQCACFAGDDHAGRAAGKRETCVDLRGHSRFELQGMDVCGSESLRVCGEGIAAGDGQAAKRSSAAGAGERVAREGGLRIAQRDECMRDGAAVGVKDVDSKGRSVRGLRSGSGCE